MQGDLVELFIYGPLFGSGLRFWVRCGVRFLWYSNHPMVYVLRVGRETVGLGDNTRWKGSWLFVQLSFRTPFITSRAVAHLVDVDWYLSLGIGLLGLGHRPSVVRPSWITLGRTSFEMEERIFA